LFLSIYPDYRAVFLAGFALITVSGEGSAEKGVSTLRRQENIRMEIIKMAGKILVKEGAYE